MTNLYGVLSPEPSALELQNRALAREAAREGFVLLKNDGALPLKNRKIALYGMGARKTVKGGLGSGSVEERYSVNIEQGLENEGFVITTRRWLDDYDAEYAATYQAYVDMVEERIKGLTDPVKIIPLAHSYVYRYPSGRLIDGQDVTESNTDTAVYVLMRQAGEGNDRRLEKGDYYITDEERANLQTVADQYAHTILVINIGGTLDMAFLDEIPGIDAVVQFVQGGEEGGNALAEVLSGKYNFSGKLTDTIPLHYEDIPFGDEFSYLNGDLNNEYYKEGIYVGYRYYDSFGKAVRYPFGYGLSYTTFALETKSVTEENGCISVLTAVTNTGNLSGKEVVQAYVSAPRGRLHKEYQRLVAFQKTQELAPGATELVTLRFPLSDCASYDEGSASTILEPGDYILRIGSSSRDTSPAAILRLDMAAIVSRHKSCCGKVDSFGELVSELELESPDVPVLKVSAPETKVFFYADPDVVETAQEKTILDSLTVAEQAELTIGGELQRVPTGALDIAGAGGKTSTALLSRGIRNVVLSDGPAGVNIVSKVCQKANGSILPAVVPERYNWGVLKKMGARLYNTDGTMIYRYATAWPVEMLLAQTWNGPLLERIGDAVGQEMLQFGITVWLAPGMNIHRNPLGGRTFEYYSEDPVLTGVMASALTRGIQRHPGCGVSVKHFCCNNTENNRNGISSNVSERALREIYLKGFEIAVKEAHPVTVMSSYNMLNHIYTANHHELLIDILRCEWGFDGLVMSDWVATNETAAKPEQCAPAGNDLIMPGNPYDRERILAAIEEGRLSPAVIRRSACRVLRMTLNSHTPVLV